MFYQAMLAFTGVALVTCQGDYVALQTVPAGCNVTQSSQTCLTLYRKYNGGTTWQEAYNYCRVIGRQLMVIPNEATQTLVESFKTSPQTGNGHVWIAGRRDPDVGVWKDVVFGTAQPIMGASAGYCAVLTPGAQLLARECYYTSRPALCQTTAQSYECTGYYVQGMCFTSTMQSFYSWFDAREYCRARPSGDLAYMYLTSPGIRSFITSEVWVGVMKQPWTMVYSNGGSMLMYYEAWRSYEGTGAGEDCTHLELNDHHLWSDKGCGLHSETFICQTVLSVLADMSTTLLTPTTTTTPTPPPTTPTTTTTTTQPTPTTTTATTTTTLFPLSRTPFAYEDIFDGSYWPRGYNGYFIGGPGSSDLLYYEQATGDVYVEDLATGSKTRLLDGNKLRELQAWYFLVSADKRYILIAIGREKQYRYSFTASYRIYDTQLGVFMEFPMFTGLAGKRLQDVQWSESGSQVTFVYGNDVYYQPSPRTPAVQLTADGYKGLSGSVFFNGVPDWMYEEDILWNRHASYFSPTGQYIVFAKFDLTEVNQMNIMVYGDKEQLYPSVMTYPYPKAGGSGPTTRVRLYVVNIESPASTPRRLEPPFELVNTDHYYTQVAWRDAVTVYVDWTNRVMNASYTLVCDVRSMRCVTMNIVKEAWIHIPAVTPWFIDNANNYLTIQSLNGYRQLASVKLQNSGLAYTEPSSTNMRYLTNSSQEVMEIAGYDSDQQVAYFLGTNGDPTQKHLFSIGTAPFGQSLQCLTCSESNDCLYVGVSFSGSGKYYLLNCEGPGIPTSHLRKIDGTQRRVLESNADVRFKLQQKLLPTKSITEITIGGGFKGRLELLFPPNFDPAVKHPVFFHVYGAPDSQHVTQDHILGGYRSNWHIHLASRHNAIIAKLDGRGTYGNGDAMRHSVHKRIGSTVVQDQIMAAMNLTSRPYVDADRMAVMGASYGGKMAGLLLAHPANIFKCGIMISPDTNMELYDAAYTERYLGLFNESRIPYDDVNVVLRGQALADKNLFIAHGTKDDNVHYQHTVQLVEALVRAGGKKFKQQIYTDDDHNLASSSTLPHLIRAMTDFLMSDCWG